MIDVVGGDGCGGDGDWFEFSVYCSEKCIGFGF